MRLSGGTEVGLDPKVDADVAACEPAAAPVGQFDRLGNFGQPKNIREKAARGVFSTSWHRKLDMIERDYGHRAICHVARRFVTRLDAQARALLHPSDATTRPHCAVHSQR